MVSTTVPHWSKRGRGRGVKQNPLPRGEFSKSFLIKYQRNPIIGYPPDIFYNIIDPLVRIWNNLDLKFVPVNDFSLYLIQFMALILNCIYSWQTFCEQKLFLKFQGHPGYPRRPSPRIPQPERAVRRVQAGRQPAHEETQGPFANQLI